MTASDVDYVAFYDKPFLKFERLLETYLAFAPRGFKSFRTAMPVWLSEKLFQKDLLLKELRAIDDGARRRRTSCCSPSIISATPRRPSIPRRSSEAAVLTMDGVGEWATTSAGIGRGSDLAITKEIHFPHSLGLLYSAFTYYTGFKVNSGEYKVMGLAPYGEPKYAQTILDHLIDLKPDGSFRLDLDYFDYCTGLTMTNARFDALFGGPPRKPEEWLTQREMDLAASIQAVTEEVVLRLARALAAETGMKQSVPGRRRRAQLRRQRQAAARRRASTTSGFSRRPATPAARSARRWRPVISTRNCRARRATAATACRRLSRPGLRAERDRAAA